MAITNWDFIKRQLGLVYPRKGLMKKQAKERKGTQCNKQQEIIPAAESQPEITCVITNL